MLEVNYRPDVKITKLGAKISDIKDQAKKDGLIELDDLANLIDNYRVDDEGNYTTDLDDLLQCLEACEITVYKPFNTDEQWQWFIKKDQINDVLDDFDIEY